MRVASYNIHKCVGRNGIFNPSLIIDVIQELDADVIALQEADERFGRRRPLLPFEELRRRTGHRPLFAEEARYFGQGWSGNLIISRLDLNVLSIERLTLPSLDPRGALSVLARYRGVRCLFLATHLSLLPSYRAAQISLLLRHVLAMGDVRTFFMGDFNEAFYTAEAWEVLCRHFQHPPCLQRTFPSRLPLLPLDQIFLTEPIDGGGVRVFVSDASQKASDHLPVYADLREAA